MRQIIWYALMIITFFISSFRIANASQQKLPAHVVFINQVRGTECCSKGSLNNLRLQIEAFKKHRIPSYFVLRYDAIIDGELSSYLKEQSSVYPELIKLGTMIEITPQLAKQAGVIYKDAEEHWYNAQNAFTIGYQPSERKKLVDRLFSSFKDVFGYYPQLTSSWLIDTDTLNYAQKKYGIKAHQITREQWGTDSYTLYGGPPHYPYPGSRSWAFIPDFQTPYPLLILRQTATDPLYNYGETEKNYTSQPNDYLKSGLDFEYFKKLINQALFEQRTTGFALLGLENSMEEIYQNEFLRQIEYMDELKDRIVFPALDQLRAFWSKEKTTSYLGKDLINNSDNQAEFVTTPEYRKRIRISKNKTFVTDYRFYHRDITDPYNDYVAQKNGYWIVPYAVDSSHAYNRETIFPETRNDLSISKQSDFKVLPFDAKKFNDSRSVNYPYFLPEPIEREVSQRHTIFSIEGKNPVELSFTLKDRYRYPIVIMSPIQIETNPSVKVTNYTHRLAHHSFLLSSRTSQIASILIKSDRGLIKKIHIVFFPASYPIQSLLNFFLQLYDRATSFLKSSSFPHQQASQ